METIFDFGFYPKIPDATGEDEPQFMVVKFDGKERISSLYSFNITVGVENYGDYHSFINRLLRQRLILGINYRGYSRSITGIASQVEFVGSVKERIYLKITLVPKISILNRNVSSGVYLNKSIPEIIGEVLGSEIKGFGDIIVNMSNLDLSRYPKLAMLCRYNESTWHFVSRLMERCGIYYYFKFTTVIPGSDEFVLPSPEALILSDHKSHELNADLYSFRVESNSLEDLAVMSSPHMTYGVVASKFVCDGFDMDRTRVQKIYPQDEKMVTFETDMNRDFNETSLGQMEFFEGAMESAEAAFANDLRLEQAKVSSQKFTADSVCPVLMAGNMISVSGFMGDRVRLLLTEIVHQGAQASYMISGLADSNEENDKSFYRSSVEAIPAEIQFRAEFATPVPKIYGLIPGIVEGPDSSVFSPYMDELGRYRIKLPFDKGERMSGSSSCWVKLMTPYGGNVNTVGMHFPLLKDTQVLIGFVGGNIDQPFIAGTIQDGTGSVVNNTRITANVIRTPSGNLFLMTDCPEPGGENIAYKNSYGYRSLGVYPEDIMGTL